MSPPIEQRAEGVPGRRNDDVTLADVLAELRLIDKRMEPLEQLQKDMATVKEMAVAWNNAKIFGRGLVTVGQAVKWTAALAAACAVIWAMFGGVLPVAAKP